jgi:hypothetical protein
LYCCSGTLGALVKNRTNETKFILSNNHVLARVNQGKAGEDINQPGAIDQHCGQTGVLADLSRFVPLQFWGKGKRPVNYVDAAVAAIRVNAQGVASASSHIIDIGTPSSTVAADAVGMAVKKTGRTTGYTTGKITAVNVSVAVGYGSRCGGAATLTASFEDQFVVQGASGGPVFSAGGDSGSLILTDGNNPVGLLFAGTSTQTIANPINRVLTDLDVSFNLSATSTSSTSLSSASELEPARAAKRRNSERLFRTRGVHGHGIGLSADGRPVIKVFVTPEQADAALAELPGEVEGVPVQIEVTEPFVAF